jgi:hypothetical protein
MARYGMRLALGTAPAYGTGTAANPIAGLFKAATVGARA